MHTCFNCWFDAVLQRRIQMGKSRAVSDWKILFRVFNAWRHQTKEKHYNHIQEEHVNEMRDLNRRLNKADGHYDRSLLHKHFLLWQVWVVKQRKTRELEQDQNSVRNKMSAFLSTGKQMLQEKQTPRMKADSDSTNNTARKIVSAKQAVFIFCHISFLFFPKSFVFCC